MLILVLGCQFPPKKATGILIWIVLSMENNFRNLLLNPLVDTGCLSILRPLISSVFDVFIVKLYS